MADKNDFIETDEAMQKTIDDVLKTVLQEGGTIADALKVDYDNLEILYALAHNNYVAGNIKDAEPIFSMLVMYDHWDSRFSMGLAACRQKKGDFQKAIDMYGIASAASGLNDPTPLYYGALCLLQLDRKEEAKACLEMATSTGNIQEHVEIRKLAQNLLDTMSN